MVRKAYKWYYMMRCSFGGMGRHFGRSLDANHDTGKLWKNLPDFRKVHERLRDVYIEHGSAFNRLKPYDSPETVYYLDPPYIDCENGPYKEKFGFDNHLLLLKEAFKLQGFVAISGYDNPYYDEFKWDNKITWGVPGHLKKGATRANAQECLWIKEAK
jgi:DNA adenine methylase